MSSDSPRARRSLAANGDLRASSIADKCITKSGDEPAPLPSPECVDAKAEIARLAALDPIERDREIKASAESLGCKTGTLERMVKAATKRAGTSQGEPIEFDEIAPWPKPVDGAALFHEMRNAIRTYVVMTEAEADTTVLWAVHSHALDAFRVTPRLGIRAPEKGCGKTQVLRVLFRVVPRPLKSETITASSLFRVIAMARPTILQDELDNTLSPESSELLGILDSGAEADGHSIRNVGDNHEPRKFKTFAAVAYGMIGRPPATLDDRTIAIEMRRKKGDEKVSSLEADNGQELDVIARKVARWAADNFDDLKTIKSDMVGLSNRRADNWKPLFKIADVAGGDWPARVRIAAKAAAEAAEDQSIKVQLLADIKLIFEAAKVVEIPSALLAEQLAKLPGRPWAEWGRAQTPISQNALARMLKPFGIAPDMIGPGDGRARGYRLHLCDDAFARYLPCATGRQHDHPNRPSVQNAMDAAQVGVSQPYSQNEIVRLEACKKSNNNGPLNGCTVEGPKNAVVRARPDDGEWPQ